jgi:hypothetical protein
VALDLQVLQDYLEEMELPELLEDLAPLVQ